MRFTSLDLRETSLGNKLLRALAVLSKDRPSKNDDFETILTVCGKDSDYRVAMVVVDGKAELRGEWKPCNSPWFMKSLKKGTRVWDDPNYSISDFR